MAGTNRPGHTNTLKISFDNGMVAGDGTTTKNNQWTFPERSEIVCMSLFSLVYGERACNVEEQ